MYVSSFLPSSFFFFSFFLLLLRAPRFLLSYTPVMPKLHAKRKARRVKNRLQVWLMVVVTLSACLPVCLL
ncbi:hypothetical protein HOY80DRAFT_987064 [Tuber brumale]|nr:hypothetical protein HOY80DRAFT_987064 [Tuber brumale]